MSLRAHAPSTTLLWMQELGQHEVEQAVSEIDFGGLSEEQDIELQRRLAAYQADPEGSTVSSEETMEQVRRALA